MRPIQTQCQIKRLIATVLCTLCYWTPCSLFAQNERNGEDAGVVEIPSIPHIQLNVNERYLDIDAEVCLREGMLELIVCSKNTKEHESIISTVANPKHIHLMLLLLEAKAGHPAKREAIDSSGTRWRDIPAKGNLVAVSLVFESNEKILEQPISHFIKGEDGEPFQDQPFLFTGSRIVSKAGQKPVYLACKTGHVVCLSSFGDEVLGMRDFAGHAKHELIWEVAGENLPPVNSSVTLRLRPIPVSR